MSSACGICRLLTFTRKRLRNGQLRDSKWIPKESILKTSDKGCDVCRLLRRAISVHIPWEKFDSFRLDSTYVAGTVTIHLRRFNHENKITSATKESAGDDISSSAVSKIALFTPKGNRIPSLGAIGPAKYGYPSISFDDRVRLIKLWIAECQREHPGCKEKHKAARSLPTRVLDVGDEEHDPYLYSSNGECEEYIALSHCWGTPEKRSKQLLTRRASFPQYCNAIPLHTMPKTFIDAVLVTRALGVRYLWIDSLCIVQDDLKDWELESSRMADVYRNASITLAADWASNSDDGCFSPYSDRKSTVASIAIKDPLDSRTHNIIARLLSDGSLIPTRETLCCHAEESNSALNTRAWSLQEWLLSRRLIRFTKSELIWECMTKTQCECRIRQWRTFEEEKPLRELKIWINTDVKLSKAGEWLGLVENYTSREITKISDRLPALSGVAAALWSPSISYHAGIWSPQFLSHMSWRTVAKRASECPMRWERESRRHPTYYAPSWSWASVTGAVKFAEHFADWASTDNVACVKQVVSQPATANPFGPVSEAKLIVEAKVTEIDIVIVDSLTGTQTEKDWTSTSFAVKPKGAAVSPDLSEIIQPDVLPPSKR
jgi:Heterokaryon incompatibility protein (HET)